MALVCENSLGFSWFVLGICGGLGVVSLNKPSGIKLQVWLMTLKS